ncbi:DUF4263 domain-containing protein [Vibrio fluvialis]|nr:DUF4263 domain-containing protein [Vibrio fluvialis]
MSTIVLVKEDLKKSECRQQLDELRLFLNNVQNTHFSETDIHNFFKDRPQLVLLMGRVLGVRDPEGYNDEIPILGKYRADFVAASDCKRNWAFVEFEDAYPNSIFQRKLNQKTQTYDWSRRFEKGYSQVIDWLYQLDVNNNTTNMKAAFGHQSLNPELYFGALIIGRDKDLDRGDCRERWEWRRGNTRIDKKLIYCNTFDGLLDDMESEYSSLVKFS